MKWQKIFIFSLFITLLPFFYSCGLDEFYELNGPYVKNNDPSKASPYDFKYFEFTTNETNTGVASGSGSGFSFLGTAVYYKIYNNLEDLDKYNSSISTLSSSTNYQQAMNSLLSNGYQELAVEGKEDTSPLVKNTSKNKLCYIRLTNYQYDPKNPDDSSQSFMARIVIDKNFYGVPMRAGGTKSFDFGRTSDDEERNVIPVTNDSDYHESSSFSDGDDDKCLYYVNMYAVSVGRDTTYSLHYSNVYHLGYVEISTKEVDN